MKRPAASCQCQVPSCSCQSSVASCQLSKASCQGSVASGRRCSAERSILSSVIPRTNWGPRCAQRAGVERPKNPGNASAPNAAAEFSHAVRRADEKSATAKSVSQPKPQSGEALKLVSPEATDYSGLK